MVSLNFSELNHTQCKVVLISRKIPIYFLCFLFVGIQSGSGVHLPSVGNRQQPQAKSDQVSTSTQPLAGANNLELGELEQLTITNDNESSYDVSYLLFAYTFIKRWYYLIKSAQMVKYIQKYSRLQHHPKLEKLGMLNIL